MNLTTFEIIRAVVVCVGGFALVRSGLGKTAGYVFVSVAVATHIVAYLIYQYRLAKLLDYIDGMSEEDWSRVFGEIDSEIAEDSNDKDATNNGVTDCASAFSNKICLSSCRNVSCDCFDPACPKSKPKRWPV